MSTEDMIAVMQASLVAGAVVECRVQGREKWVESTQPFWNWAENDYRIRPAPRRLYQAQHPTSGLCGPVYSSPALVLTPWQADNGFTVVTFVEETKTT